MNATRSRQAVARIQSLAGLDAGGPGMLSTVLEQLGRVLAFDSAAYYHLDDQGRPQMLTEDPDVLSVVPLYLDAHMQRAEREVARPFAMAAREDFGPQLRAQLITVPYRRFLLSDYYNLLLRPIRIHDCVSLVARLPDGTPTGALKFYRRTGHGDFRREELGELARLEPFLAAALLPRDPMPLDADDAQGRALMIVTPQGQLLWMSSEAESLCMQAFGSRWRRDALPGPLQGVLQRLYARHAGEAALPRLQWRDARGEFVVQARRLGAVQGTGESVALELEQRLPRRVRMLQRLGTLDLPPRQFQIAGWLTGADSEPRIAQRLGISRNTLVYHRRRLYERMAVHSRREFQHSLSGMTQLASNGHGR